MDEHFDASKSAYVAPINHLTNAYEEKEEESEDVHLQPTEAMFNIQPKRRTTFADQPELEQ